MVEILVSSLLAIVLIVIAWQFYRGHDRFGQVIYRNSNYPPWIRNIPVACGPFGGAFAVAAASIFLVDYLGLPHVLIRIASYVVIAGLLLGIVFLIRVPEFAKPRWSAAPPSPLEIDERRPSRWTLIFVAVIGFTAWILLDFRASVLIGTGIAISFGAAARSTRPRGS